MSVTCKLQFCQPNKEHFIFLILWFIMKERCIMKIILIRHGDPDYEKDCITELGHKQVKVAAQRLLKEEIDEVYSSPLGRARQTAQAFLDASGIGNMTILDFMQEIRFGREGALYDNKWNPWLGAAALIKEGKDLQSAGWRQCIRFFRNPDKL